MYNTITKLNQKLCKNYIFMKRKAEIKEIMKFKRKIYKIVRYTKNDKEYYYNLIEDTDGLYAEEEQKDGSIQRTKIGNFFLRYIKVDNNDKEDSSSKILHYFQVYYIDNTQLIKAEKYFCFTNGQYVTQKIESGFPPKVQLDSTTKEVLNYFKGYLKELIRNGVETGIYVENEEITKNVKEFLIHFVQFIQGRENLFIEMDFKHVFGEDIQIKNFYDEYKINDNKDLYLVNQAIDEKYKKIGFYYIRKNYYVIDLPALRQLMEKECNEKMTARNLNEGLKSLELIASYHCYKSTSTDYNKNLTALYKDKLIALAYPNGMPTDAPTEEEPTLTDPSDYDSDGDYDDDDHTNNNDYWRELKRQMDAEKRERKEKKKEKKKKKEEKKQTFDDVIEKMRLKVKEKEKELEEKEPKTSNYSKNLIEAMEEYDDNLDF